MKEFIDYMQKDLMEDEFSAREWLVYGVGYPLLIVAGCIISSLLW